MAGEETNAKIAVVHQSASITVLEAPAKIAVEHQSASITVLEANAKNAAGRKSASITVLEAPAKIALVQQSASITVLEANALIVCRLKGQCQKDWCAKYAEPMQQEMESAKHALPRTNHLKR